MQTCHSSSWHCIMSTNLVPFQCFHLPFIEIYIIVYLNSIGRLIVTKRQDRDDDNDDEYEDITNLYKKKDG